MCFLIVDSLMNRNLKRKKISSWPKLLNGSVCSLKDVYIFVTNTKQNTDQENDFCSVCLHLLFEREKERQGRSIMLMGTLAS